MEFKNTYSSIVIVGDGFTHSVFNPSEFKRILEEPDKEQQIILPFLSRFIYPDLHYKIIITSDNINVGYSGDDSLPSDLKKIVTGIIKNFENLNITTIGGIGINLNVTISDDEVGMTGYEYCRKNFLAIENIEERLGTTDVLANTAKLIYRLETIKYNVDIEPNFKSEGKFLHIKINAHQDCENVEDLEKSLKKYDSIKSYLQNFHSKLLGQS